MTEWYLSIKLLHILSATLFFGTGLGTAYYLWQADRHGDVNVIAVVARRVVWADWVFTLPAGIIQPLTGFALMYMAGIPITASWIVASLILFLIVALCWLPVVWLQIKVAQGAEASVRTGAPLPASHRRYMRWWYSLGWPAFLSTLAIFYLMVFKPAL